MCKTGMNLGRLTSVKEEPGSGAEKGTRGVRCSQNRFYTDFRTAETVFNM